MEYEERAAGPLAGGLQRGYQCGMVWGSALAAGGQAYRLYGSGPQAEAHAVLAAQAMVDGFRRQNKHVDCREITGIDLSDPNMGAVVRFLLKSMIKGSCFGMSARYAHLSHAELGAAFSADGIDPGPGPLSCSALLAQKLGASSLHTVMAAGLAGGIGLSGGACGALGAAIWIQGMRFLQGGGQIAYKAPYAEKLIECFTQCTGGEFLCAKITGRRFESVGEHAAYLRDGGCAKIIEALAV